jgi:DNA polymerase, archaea type
MSETRTLLYGANEERFIVAIESPQDRPDLVQVYVQDSDGLVKPYHDVLVPFIYTKMDENALVDARDIKVTPLLGGNPLNARVHGSWRTLSWIRKYATDAYLPQRKSQYAIHTGKTLFKGMDFDDVLRLYVDIEVITSEGFDFPNPDRPGDKVMIISMLTNKGEEIVLHGDDEKTVLKDFIKEFRRIDPTVVVGHNIFNFDLPYLETRFLMHGIDFALGRNGSSPDKFITNIKLAEKDKEYTNWQVWGRHVMDTMFMAMQWDVVQRKLDSYSLKDIAKTLGFAAEDREYVDGSQITKVWQTDRQRLIRYALDDVRETRQIDLTMGGAIFYLTQMVPMSLQDAWRYGAGTKIDSMFAREYYRQDWSLPLASPKQDYGGGYAEARVTGLTSGRIAGIDVASLYPTIMETAEVISHKDELNMFGTVLRVLKKERLRIKRAAKTFKDQGMKRQAQMEDARQNSMKLVINSMYGWLGWEFGMFNDYDEAARVTTIGQSIIKKMIEVAEGYGSTVIKVDTDGLLMTIPELWIDAEEAYTELIQDNVNAWYPGGGIEIEHDGNYAKALIVDDKSYVLLGLDGSIKIKGNTLKSRSMEPFCREFLDSCIRAVMDARPEDIREIYDQVDFRVASGMLGLSDILSKRELNQSLEEYRNKRSGGGNPIAQYEVALRSRRPLRKGDRVAYYISKPKKTWQVVGNKMVERDEVLPTSALATEASDYNFDYFEKHYTKRLVAVTKRLLVILGEDSFRVTFPEIKLNKKDLEKINKEEDD